ncbi:class I glutamine amidotransferase-like protein [Lentithecium fluviatile CBS 122367]|uniref:Class I glutamine amidotransferase-like protein n=1 Tax=Lentithecium fluviatile CBS 122367 TaxID=1168545 RepID=A0A6G1J9M3_9PLEO|nr:class I glutamine amidotransferase-like protein [Lentithecium fluviatile CBS 122367]
MAAPAPKPLRIGVLYEQTQMSDLTGLDILGNISSKTVEMISEIIPAIIPLKPFAIPMEFLYIASSVEPTWTSPEMFVRPTHTYATAPRDLDIILLGGPNPATVPEESLVFLREAALQTKIVMTTCTGGMWLARAGVLDGKKATTNRILLETSKQMFPKVEWLDQRWVTEEGLFEGAQIWTAGGAGCGIGMVMEYAIGNFNQKMVELACLGLDFDIKGRTQFYKEPLPTIA